MTTRRYLWSCSLASAIFLGSIPFWGAHDLVAPGAGLLAALVYEAVWWGHVHRDAAPTR